MKSSTHDFHYYYHYYYYYCYYYYYYYYYYIYQQWQRLFHSAYYDGMDALSKVTRYVRDVYEGLQPAGENTQTEAQYSAAKREVDFEHLGDTASTSPVNGQSSLPEKVRIIFNMVVHL